MMIFFFFFSSRRRHTRYWRDWSSDVCSSDLQSQPEAQLLDRQDPGEREGAEDRDHQRGCSGDQRCGARETVGDAGGVVLTRVVLFPDAVEQEDLVVGAEAEQDR